MLLLRTRVKALGAWKEWWWAVLNLYRHQGQNKPEGCQHSEHKCEPWSLVAGTGGRSASSECILGTRSPGAHSL